MITPSLEVFREKCRSGNLIPVYREILADTETPVSAFLKVGNRPHAYLLESVVGGDRIGRYSFIGGEPFLVLKTRGREIEMTREGETTRRPMEAGEDPLSVLEGLMAELKFVTDADLPPFCGGAVGYVGYDTVRFFERLPSDSPDEFGLPETYFALTDTLLIFDHVRHKIRVLCNARVNVDPDAAYSAAVAKVDQVVEGLRSPLSETYHPPERPPNRPQNASLHLEPRTSRADYLASVERARDYIAAGDCVQVVLSQRIAVDIDVPAFDIYRALRSVNPSPYMFFLQFEECQIVGSSPEILVTEHDGFVNTRPIAGTIRRGKTLAEDEALIRQLLADPKERSEHVMLVDLHRNDIGRVCEYGSVIVNELMTTEKYSHVIHIVSNIVGRLRQDRTAYDLLRAAFPAGTLSGAPKVRAMEIIEELEPVRRGPYGGVIGYISFSGDMDTCITLRTIVVKDGRAYVQAGGGIVADSVPESEYEECMSKAAAMLRALEMAQAGLE